MYIKDITLHNFRNYKDQRINFEQGINLLVGSNAQGKTNALEAIYYLITGKSYKVKQENELIFWGEKNFFLRSTFTLLKRNILLESYYEPNKKVMKINQLPVKRLSDYVGTVNTVFFSPDDLNIIKNSPNDRRRFLDLIITQIKPGYISLLNTYIKIIKQKNILLKKEKNLNSLKSQLMAWNEQLVDIGSKIITNRSQFTDSLNRNAHPIFKKIFSEKHNVELCYLSLGKRSLDEALRSFPELLESKMAQEIEKRSVLLGPHRDDLLIDINGRAARLFASQGQQRSLVLCLKLAEMEIILNARGEYPILLLDDVLSELDEYRRQYLLDYISSSQKQTIITMTGADEKIINNDTAVYNVSNGNIRRTQ